MSGTERILVKRARGNDVGFAVKADLKNVLISLELLSKHRAVCV